MVTEIHEEKSIAEPYMKLAIFDKEGAFYAKELPGDVSMPILMLASVLTIFEGLDVTLIVRCRKDISPAQEKMVDKIIKSVEAKKYVEMQP